ncbi:class I SAM-dependent methyltransferase [Streptomyces sp. NPDC006193]|uniref:class I SAM-dependent methyltransferase n=1 Tax=Streptomyces sp. NPDC006193 TaxID=3155717 RepID=UPI0033A482CD
MTTTDTTATADYWEPLWAGGRRYREVGDTEAALLAAHIGPGRGRPALDIGTGDGAPAYHLHRLGHRTTGVDCAPRQLMDFAADDLSALPASAVWVVSEIAGRREAGDPRRHLGVSPAEAEILTAGWSVVRTADIDVLRCYALCP